MVFNHVGSGGFGDTGAGFGSGSGSGGSTGDSLHFASIIERDNFFNVDSNLYLLETNIQVVVTTDDTANKFTIYIWKGLTNPATYDNTFWSKGTIEVAGGSIQFADGKQLSSAGDSIAFKDVLSGSRTPVMQSFTSGNTSVARVRGENNVLPANNKDIGTNISNPTWSQGLISGDGTLKVIRFDFVNAVDKVVLKASLDSVLYYENAFFNVPVGEYDLVLDAPLDYRDGQVLDLSLSNIGGPDVVVVSSTIFTIPWLQETVSSWEDKSVTINSPVPQVTLLDDVDTGFNGADVIAIVDKTLFSFSSTESEVSSHDVSDPTNITHLKTFDNPFLFPIQSYIASPLGGAYTRVLSTDSFIPANVVVEITGGPYASLRTVVFSDELGQYFDINVAFTTDAAGTTFGATVYIGLNDLDTSGKYIFGVDRDDSFFIYEGENLRPIGALPNMPEATALRGLTVYGNFAYLFCTNSGSTCGLLVVDITDLRNPKIVKEIDKSDRYFKGLTSGNTLYCVGTGGSDLGLVSYDISDPANPQLLQKIGGFPQNTNQIVKRGNFLYIVSFSGNSLLTIDVTDRSAMSLVNTLSVQTGPNGLEIFGKYLIITTGASNIAQFVNIDNPILPVLLDTIIDISPDVGSTDPKVVGSILYIPTKSPTGLRAYRLNVLDTLAGTIGALEVEKLHVGRDVNVDGNVDIAGSLSINGNIELSGTGGVSGRVLFGLPNDVTDVTKESDLPTASGGVISLLPNTSNIIYNETPSLGFKSVFIDNPIQLPSNELNATQISSTNLGGTVLTYTGSGAMYNSDINFIGFHSHFNNFSAVPNGSVFDLTGSLPPGFEFFPRLSLLYCGYFNILKIGKVENISFNYTVGGFFACQGGPGSGFVLKNVRESVVDSIRFIDWVDAPNTVVMEVYGDNSFLRISGCTFNQGPNSSLFYISPLIASTNSVLLSNNQHQGTATPFKEGSTGIIDIITTATNNGTVTAVQDDGGGLAEFVANNSLTSARSVFLTVSGYPTTELLVGGASPTTFTLTDIDDNAILFTGNSSGTYSGPAVQISTTSNLAGIGSGAVLNILQTINYDGGARASSVDNPAGTFIISKPFVSIESPTNATWDSGSLKPTDPRLLSLGNVGIPDSAYLVAISGQGGVDATVITTINTWVDLNIADGGGLVIGLAEMSRWVLMNKFTGEVRYNGLENFDGLLSVSITAVSSGSSQLFSFRVIVNGVAIPGIEMSQELSNDSGNVSFSAALHNIVTGDLVRVQVSNLDGTSNIVIQDILVNT